MDCWKVHYSVLCQHGCMVDHWYCWGSTAASQGQAAQRLIIYARRAYTPRTVSTCRHRFLLANKWVRTLRSVSFFMSSPRCIECAVSDSLNIAESPCTKMTLAKGLFYGDDTATTRRCVHRTSNNFIKVDLISNRLTIYNNCSWAWCAVEIETEV